MNLEILAEHAPLIVEPKRDLSSQVRGWKNVYVNYTPQRFIVAADDIFRTQNYQRYAKTCNLRKKATRLYPLIEKFLADQSFITPETLEETLKMHEYLIDHLHKFIDSNQDSVFILPKEKTLALGIQVYRDKRSYIHLLHQDAKKQKGGYKFFSRSIDMQRQELVAHLMAPLRHERDLKNITNELKFMKNRNSHKRFLSLKRSDIIAGQNPFLQEDAKEQDLANAIFNNAEIIAKDGHQAPILEQNPKKKKTRTKDSNPFEERFFISFTTPLYKGDLRRNFIKSKKAEKVLKIARKSILALQEMHDQYAVHGDIKPANFFYSRQNSKINVVLADFGFAQFEDTADFGRHLQGSRGYIAPEICRNRLKYQYAFGDFHAGVKADLFAYGMTLYSILHRRDNKIKSIVRKLNAIALPPKGAKKGNVEQINELINDFKIMHHNETLRLATKKHENTFDRVRVELSRIALQLLSPSPSLRPSLTIAREKVNLLLAEH